MAEILQLSEKRFWTKFSQFYIFLSIPCERQPFDTILQHGFIFFNSDAMCGTYDGTITKCSGNFTQNTSRCFAKSKKLGSNGITTLFMFDQAVS